jgi:hypothetical protein
VKQLAGMPRRGVESCFGRAVPWYRVAAGQEVKYRGVGQAYVEGNKDNPGAGMVLDEAPAVPPEGSSSRK